MRRLFTLLGLMLVAIFAVSAVASTAAFAEELQKTPLNLPFKEGEKLTGNSEGNTVFQTGGLTGKVTCTSAPGEGTVESNLPPLGLFHIHFTNCENEASKAKCTGLGEGTAGVILALGKWHLVWDELGEKFELHTATLFLVETVHFNCSALVLVEVKGEVLCLDLKPEESGKKHSFHCEPAPLLDSWCKEDLELTPEVHMCAGLVTPKLEASVNKGAFKEAVEEALGFFEGENAVAAMKL